MSTMTKKLTLLNQLMSLVDPADPQRMREYDAIATLHSLYLSQQARSDFDREAVARTKQKAAFDPRVKDDLPPMVGGRKPKAIDVPCPTCRARPGKPCLLMTRGGGANATVIDPPQPKEGYHSRRHQKAKGL